MLYCGAHDLAGAQTDADFDFGTLAGNHCDELPRRGAHY